MMMTMMNIRELLLLSLSFLIISTTVAQPYRAQDTRYWLRLQSGIDFGSTFAGGLILDGDRLYLTGATYARGFFLPEPTWQSWENGKLNSDCFLVGVQLPRTNRSMPTWTEPTRFGFTSEPEACSVLHYIANYDRMMIGGANTGLAGAVDVEGEPLPAAKDVSVLGEVISLPIHPNTRDVMVPQHYVFGGRGFFHSEVNYPFAITSDYKRKLSGETAPKGQAVFVASLYSSYAGELQGPSDSNYLRPERAEEWDFTTPYEQGNVWGINIQRLEMKYSNATNIASILENPMSLERTWMQSITTLHFDTLRGAALHYVNDYLLVALSTADKTTDSLGASHRKYHTIDDIDGVVLKLDPETGDTWKNDTVKSTMRIQTGAGDNDIIFGMCLEPPTVPDDPIRYAYVVGSTTGLLDWTSGDDYAGGTIYKIDLEDLSVVWSNQIFGGENVRAIDCAVTTDKTRVYVVGEALEGASLRGWESRGRDDIWIRQYDTEDGIPLWELQLGSTEDDTLARHGAVVVDPLTNNAIVYGNTRGSIGRARSEKLKMPDDTNDIFVLTISVDGGYLGPDPKLSFQVSPSYVDTGGLNYWFLITMFLAAFLLTSILISCYSEWKPLNQVLPARLFQTEEGKSLTTTNGETQMTEDYSESWDKYSSSRGETASTVNAFSTHQGDDADIAIDGDVLLGCQLGSLLEIRSGDGSEKNVEPIDVTEGFYSPTYVGRNRCYGEDEKVELDFEGGDEWEDVGNRPEDDF